MFVGSLMEADGLIDLAVGTTGGFLSAPETAGIGALIGAGVDVIGLGAVYVGQGISGWGDRRLAGDLATARAGTRGTESTTTEERATEIAKKNLDEAAKGDGEQVNHDLGPATRAEADRLGKKWVGPGYRIARDGRTLVSADGTRTYRPPSLKKNGVAAGRTQANFEVRNPHGERGRKILSDGHMDITDP